MRRDIPGGPVVETLPASANDAGLIPGWGVKIPHASHIVHLLCTKQYQEEYTNESDTVLPPGEVGQVHQCLDHRQNEA